MFLVTQCLTHALVYTTATSLPAIHPTVSLEKGVVGFQKKGFSRATHLMNMDRKLLGSPQSEEPGDVLDWRAVAGFLEYKALSQMPLHESLTTSLVTTRKSNSTKELMF